LITVSSSIHSILFCLFLELLLCYMLMVLHRYLRLCLFFFILFLLSYSGEIISIDLYSYSLLLFYC
jgi:hypothetical protein